MPARRSRGHQATAGDGAGQDADVDVAVAARPGPDRGVPLQPAQLGRDGRRGAPARGPARSSPGGAPRRCGRPRARPGRRRGPRSAPPSPVLITYVSDTAAKLTGSATGPSAVPNAIRPMPPGAISRRHSTGVSLSMTGGRSSRNWPGGTCAPAPSRAAGVVHSTAASCRSVGRAGPGRVPLQVFQVPQAHPGSGGHLLPAQMQLLATPLHSLAQVAGVGWRRPPVLLRLLDVVNGHRDRDAAAHHGPAPPHLLASIRCQARAVGSAHDQPEQVEVWPAVAFSLVAQGRWSVTGRDRVCRDRDGLWSLPWVTSGTGRRGPCRRRSDRGTEATLAVMPHD